MEDTESISFPDARNTWRIPQIDGLRAMAMLMVYIFHAYLFGHRPALPVSILSCRFDLFALFAHFGTGVDLFMVLSGFCLFWPLCKSTAALNEWNWKDYAKRRLRRIVPPYYAAIAYSILLPLLLVVIFRLLGIRAHWLPLPSIWQIITHLLFIHTLSPQTWDGITGSFWSLGLEAQFYVMFPLVIFGFRRFRLKMIFFMIVLSVLFRTASNYLAPPGMAGWGFILSISFLGRWMQFACGMLAAWVVAKYWREGRNRGALAGSLEIAAALAIYLVATETQFSGFLSLPPAQDLLLGVAFGILIVALCTSQTPVGAVFSSKFASWLGLISYSFYLVHQPAAWYFSGSIRTLGHLSEFANFLMLCTGGFALVLAISYLFFIAFERPCLKSPRRRTEPAASSMTIPGIGPEEEAAP